MVEFQEERLVYRNIHKMSEDFVNWFFDEKAPEIPKHMHLVTAACMWEGWKGAIRSVPEAIITAPIEAMRCGPAASYVLGWNDCRAQALGESR